MSEEKTSEARAAPVPKKPIQGSWRCQRCQAMVIGPTCGLCGGRADREEPTP